jgi:D-alanyl-D-alanine carboxypeptidase
MSSALGMVILGERLLEYPDVMEWVGTQRTFIERPMVKGGKTELHNTNHLIVPRYPGVEGMKTGYTRAAGRILVSSAVRNDRRLVAVTIDDPDDWKDHTALMEDGFSRFAVQNIIREGQRLGTVEIIGGDGGHVTLTAAEEFSYPLAEGERISILLSGTGFAYAPVVQGEDAGFAHILVDGKPVGKVRMQYHETIEREKEPERSFWEKLFGGNS